MTEPHDPEETPTRAEGEHPPSGEGSTPWSSSPADPPTEPSATRSDASGTAAAARQRRWSSRRVRVGAVGTLAALVLLGGGFGAGFAVATAGAASAPSPSAHATAKAHPRRGVAATRKRQQQPGAAPAAGPSI